MQIRSPLFHFPFIIESATFHHKGETDMNNDIIKLLNLEDDCVITAINFSDRQTKVVSLAKKPVENTAHHLKVFRGEFYRLYERLELWSEILEKNLTKEEHCIIKMEKMQVKSEKRDVNPRRYSI